MSDIVFFSSHPHPTRIFLDALIPAAKDFQTTHIISKDPALFKADVRKVFTTAHMIIMEVSTWSAEILEETKGQKPRPIVAVYIDNPQGHNIPEPGRTSIIKILAIADFALVANRKLELPKMHAISVPIGHSLVPSESPKALFLQKNGIAFEDQTTWFYIGGANDDYFESALPLFHVYALKAMEDFPNPIVLVFIRHPRSKRNQDVKEGAPEKEVSIIATLKTEMEARGHKLIESDNWRDAFQAADLTIYHQTTTSHALADCKKRLAQIGPGSEDDLLCTNGIAATVISGEMLGKVAKVCIPKSSLLRDAIGYDPEWATNFTDFLTQQAAAKH